MKEKYYRSILSVLLLLSLLGNTECNSPSGLPLFYWKKSASTENFGDRLSMELVIRIVGGPVEYVRYKDKRKKLFAIGSVMRLAQTNDVIWGAGVNGKSLQVDRYGFTQLDVRALRGPLTRGFLMANFGIECPEVYGDPALLIPYLFPEFKKAENPEYDFIIIPHFSEQAMFPRDKFPNVVYPTEPWNDVIAKIANSKFVISSSLHGLVVAEAFGIPARLLKVTWKEPIFKYTDYYYGTGRFNFKYAESVEEALAMGGEPPIECDLEKLYDAFPKEFWIDKVFHKPSFIK